jgi:hypothetical protein
MKIMPINNSKTIIKGLFSSAQKNGGMECLYTLVRVEGIVTYDKDPILAFYDDLKALNEGDLQGIKKLLLDGYPAYSLIANLINNSVEKQYEYWPFSTGPNGTGPEFIPPDPILFVSELIAKVNVSKESIKEFAELFLGVFESKFWEAISTAVTDLESYKKELVNARNFLMNFLEVYFERLKLMGKGNKYQKFEKRFEVVEALLDPIKGLYGFNVHFSNGSKATFQRLPNKTEGFNIMSWDNHVSLFLGPRDGLKPIWLVDGKPLYEIGLPGRYNIPGEWKPLFYPGETDMLFKEAHEMAKDKADKRIMGCLFYAMVTCHHAIEFVVKSNFDLPYPISVAESSWGKLVLEKIDPAGSETNQNVNRRVYDGTLHLKKFGLEEMETGLSLIHLTLNRLAFRLDGKFDWFLKYPLVGSADGVITTKEDDQETIGDYLKNLKGSDTIIIDSAIDWYVNGNKAQNVFNQYLCYCIAIEALALPFIEGDMEASKKYGVTNVSKAELKENKKKCIHQKHAELYAADPIGFVEQAYFDCVISLKQSIKKSLGTIFGDDSEAVKLMFEKKVDGYTLHDLRSELAHGNFSLADRGHENIIRRRVDEMGYIAQQFILRLSMGLQPGEKYKKFARTATFGFVTVDPRSTAVLSDFSIIPQQDWKIKWEWLNND